MQKQNLNVNFNGQVFIGFVFSDLPLAAALTVAAQQIDEAADAARVAVLGDSLRALEYERASVEATWRIRSSRCLPNPAGRPRSSAMPASKANPKARKRKQRSRSRS